MPYPEEPHAIDVTLQQLADMEQIIEDQPTAQLTPNQLRQAYRNILGNQSYQLARQSVIDGERIFLDLPDGTRRCPAVRAIILELIA